MREALCPCTKRPVTVDGSGVAQQRETERLAGREAELQKQIKRLPEHVAELEQRGVQDIRKLDRTPDGRYMRRPVDTDLIYTKPWYSGPSIYVFLDILFNILDRDPFDAYFSVCIDIKN